MLELSALLNGKESQEFHREGYEIYKKYGRDAALIHFGKKYLIDLDYHFMVDRQLKKKIGLAGTIISSMKHDSIPSLRLP